MAHDNPQGSGDRSRDFENIPAALRLAGGQQGQQDGLTAAERLAGPIPDVASLQSGQESNDVFGIPKDHLRPGPSGVFYQDGDQWAPSKYTPAKRADLQVALVKSGLLDRNDLTQLGYWDVASAQAYARVLVFASANGMSDDQALRTIMSDNDAVNRSQPGPVVTLSNPKDIEAMAKEISVRVTGKKMSDATLKSIVAAVHESQRLDQAAAFAQGNPEEADLENPFVDIKRKRLGIEDKLGISLGPDVITARRSEMDTGGGGTGQAGPTERVAPASPATIAEEKIREADPAGVAQTDFLQRREEFDALLSEAAARGSRVDDRIGPTRST